MINGYTLIELLVVMAIMSIVGIFTIANFNSFGEGQSVKNAALDIQSLLRQAQTNAVANVKCDTAYGATWAVGYVNDQNLKLRCQEPAVAPSPSPSPAVKKTLTLTGNRITAYQPLPAGCATIAHPGALYINFTPLSGKVSFDYGLWSLQCNAIKIMLENTKTHTTYGVTVEKGGNIYAR